MNIFTASLKHRFKMIGLLLLSLSAVLFLTVQSVQTAVLTPSKVSLYPSYNAHDVSLTATVSITYSEAINPVSVLTDTFAVFGMQTGLFTQTYTVSNGTVGFAPMQPFRAGEMIQVSV